MNTHFFRQLFYPFLLTCLLSSIAPAAWAKPHPHSATQSHSHQRKHSHTKRTHLKKSKQPLRAEDEAQTSDTQPIAVTRNLDDVTTHLNAAYSAFQQADYTTARQRYQQALILDGNNRDALLGLAVSAQRQGQPSVALHFFRLVWQNDPSDPIANAGLALLSRNDGDGTESRLKQLLAQQPSAPLHFALANHYAAQSRWADARLYFGNTLFLEPKNARVHFGLAITLDHLQQVTPAIHHYQQALQLDTRPNSSFDHAGIQLRLNQLTELQRNVNADQ